MKSKILKALRKSYFIIVLVFLFDQSYCQIPKSNPYSTGSESSWTNQLKWNKVFLLKDFKEIIRNEGNEIDSLKLHEALKSISDSGGGILYFPKGTYYFQYNITLMENVILRGEMEHGNKRC